MKTLVHCLFGTLARNHRITLRSTSLKMFMKSRFLILALLFGGACSDGFQKFAPPANSISGRGGKVHPKILTSTPSNGSTVSPVTGLNGSRLVVIFDMTMKTDMTPVINTWVREVEGNSIVWYSIANSGVTFSWSSTNYLNDTLTIQLGWVRWPENNIIGFDFDNNTLVNLDDMTLDNTDKISFTVGWNPGRYKAVPTGQYACYRYSTSAPVAWTLENTCKDSTNGGGGVIGSQNYPAGQNGFTDPRNQDYGPTLYGAGAGGYVNGRRFPKSVHPMNIVPANCTGSSTQQGCNPYSIDTVTNLVWKTCSQGQYYADEMYVGGGEKCAPAAGSDFTWGEAVNACASMNTAEGGTGYAGRKDWRLPTIEELEQLPDYGVRVRKSGTLGEPAPGYPEGPAIDGYQEDQFTFVWEGAFPVTPITKGYWTATGIAATISGTTQYSNALVVEFKKGGMGAGGGSGSLLESHRRTTNRKKVRCVAGPNAEPAAQSLTPKVEGQGAAMTGIGATFWRYDNDATFNVKSTVPAYDIETNTQSVTVTFNRLPNSLQAGVAGNYCIAPASAAAVCTPSAFTISTATQVSGNPKAYKLSLGSAMGANTAYKLFVTGVQSQSDLWQTGTAYTVNTYLYDSGNVYRVAIAHTSSSVAADVGGGNLVQLSNFAPSTFYAINTKLYVPATQQVVNVALSYTSSASASTDITNGTLSLVKDIVPISVQNLTLSHGLFNGIQPRTATPPTNTVFNIVNATSPDPATVIVTFNRLPDNSALAVTAPGNYKIISSGSAALFGSPQIAPVSSVTLSGYTATLTATLANNTPYAVVTQNITFLGAQVVDDTVNKLRWQRCRKGTLDVATCADDGDATNDSVYWNDALNYCDSLNAIRYDNDSATSTSVRYAWRAPTINELRTISNRSIFATTGAAISTTIFPTPNVLAEDFVSSTNYTLNGDPDQSGSSPPNFNQAWGFNFITGFSGIIQKDNSTLIPGLKPPKKNVRCVRGLP